MSQKTRLRSVYVNGDLGDQKENVDEDAGGIRPWIMTPARGREKAHTAVDGWVGQMGGWAGGWVGR